LTFDAEQTVEVIHRVFYIPGQPANEIIKIDISQEQREYDQSDETVYPQRGGRFGGHL
jgi:hypothetical protein